MASVTHTIEDEKYPEFLEAFLVNQPVPLDPQTSEPTMTDNQWVKEWGRIMYWNAYRHGLKRARDIAHPVVADPDILR